MWYDARAVKNHALTGEGTALERTPLDRALLLDFYGELLTEKQRRLCDLHWNEDLSLAEIAEHESTTRQAVWDNLLRAEAKLRQFEEKTGIVRRYLLRREQIEEVRERLFALLPDNDESRAILRRLDELM